ncbi:MAG: blue (type 1) copper domain protein [Candidatus Saccharibacteria bacterium]|nr:blue (type 1) copper domain protein [Candidatus Saccharibacteria bacterium]
MKDKKSLVLILVVVAVVVIVVGAVLALGGNKKSDQMGSMQMTNTDTSQATKEAAQSTNAINIKNYAFDPSNVTVKVGTTVTWTNQDSIGHTVTSDDSDTNTMKLESKLLSKGETYSVTFTKAGTYTYHCTPHTYMKGTVTVTE